jgi:hypothetical protein
VTERHVGKTLYIVVRRFFSGVKALDRVHALGRVVPIITDQALPAALDRVQGRTGPGVYDLATEGLTKRADEAITPAAVHGVLASTLSTL